MKLHVFNDSHGFFLNLAVRRILESGAPGQQRFVNLANKTIYPNERVTYLEKTIPAFRKYIKKLEAFDEIIFYPLDGIGAHFLLEVKKQQPGVRVTWVFWGYEYYHRPENYLGNFDPIALNWYHSQKTFARKSKAGLTVLAKNILRIPKDDGQLLDRCYSHVGRFFSFLHEDFKNIISEKPQLKATWNPICFLSIDEITAGLSLATGRKTKVIMVGHAATPTMNHAEVLEQLATFNLPQQVFMTLEYGDFSYREFIKQKAIKLFADKVEFMEQRMSLSDYYHYISRAGFAIFPFRWQEGLGNIIFLIWNGSKVFLKQSSAVYKQFREWGILVFSIEKDLHADSFDHLLPDAEAAHNKTVLERILDEEKIKVYWKVLVNE